MQSTGNVCDGGSFSRFRMLIHCTAPPVLVLGIYLQQQLQQQQYHTSVLLLLYGIDYETSYSYDMKTNIMSCLLKYFWYEYQKL